MSTARATVGIRWWERGRTPAERHTPDVPDWVGFVEAVLARPPDPAPLPADLTGTGGFAVALGAFAAEAGDRLVGLAPDADPLRADFETRLRDRLARLAARTLVLELNVARVTGRLGAEGPAGRFREFVGRYAWCGELTALCAEYPVLARLLAQTCLRAAETLVELLHRYAADRQAIVSGLLGGVDPGRLLAVDTGAGDGHHGGRTVAVLRLATGARIVYKPRPLAAHRSFNTLLAWFNGRLGDADLRALNLLERDGYGWVEFVAHAPCASRADLSRFYRRQGVLLALLYALDGTDVHYENVVAHADQPVLVDVETLFHPVLAPPGPDPATRALSTSVYQAALLPRVLLGEDATLDVSGLGGDRGTRSPVESVHWEADGTDEMRLVRRPGVFIGAVNRPTLGGADAEPGEFTAELVGGFLAGHAALSRDRHELLGPHGLLRAFVGHDVRVVVRATREYSALLDESTHPDLLRDAAEREEVLGSLRARSAGDPLRSRLVEDELTQLWDGDIPYFHTRPESVDLWSATGARVPAALPESGLNRAVRCLLSLDEVDRSDQEWIIRAAMATRVTARPHEVGDPVASPALATSPDPERLLAAARGIGDQIVARAYRAEGRANWLGLELLDDRFWHVAPLDASLGSGYCGTALFLAELAQVTGTPRYADVARAALSPVPELLHTLAERRAELGVLGSGGFAGLGGITYALIRLSAVLGGPGFDGWVDAAVRLTAEAVHAEDDRGVLAGSAGGLAALLVAHEATGSATARLAASACAARLLDAPLPADPGFAHGAAGVGWALLRYARAAGDARYERAGLAALRRAATGAADVSWCRGRSGIALAVADSPAALADPELADLLEHAVADVSALATLPNHSLCHGEAGALELLGAVGPVPIGRASALLAAVDAGPRCGTPGGVPSPGLLTGLAGIGHSLLRLGFATHIPAVLRLQSPRTPTGSR